MKKEINGHLVEDDLLWLKLFNFTINHPSFFWKLFAPFWDRNWSYKNIF